MGIDLRQYQSEINKAVQMSWGIGNRYVLMVLPTGAGKTVCLSDVVDKEPGAVCVIAHRQELVSQISMALAMNGIVHRVIAPTKVIKMIVAMQMRKFGRQFYDHQSHVAVAGVDTLTRRKKLLASWLPTVKLWVIDEAHHVLTKNKWGIAVEMFPNARGLGVTATPLRADGKGLGADNDGEFHDMVVGPSMRDLINEGYLTDYRIFAPVSNDLGDKISQLDVSKTTGDYKKDEQAAIVATSSLVAHGKNSVTGDVVSHYLKHARGKLGITFVPSMDIGEEITRQYNDAGIPAMLVNAKTPDDERADISRRFEKRELLQLVNVDIFGEGYDLPSLEVVSFARKTASYGLYVQMFGRVLRLMIDMNLHPNWNYYTADQRLHAIATSGKTHGMIIDHVGNVVTHGLPDAPREWSLERRDKRAKSEDDDVIPLKSCPSCTLVYERYKKACPECGHVPEIADRSGPEFVDGDLSELSQEILAAMRGEVDQADSPIADQVMEYRRQLQLKHTKDMYVTAHCNRMTEKLQHQQHSQAQLRDLMAWWAGHRRAEGISDDEIMKIFYLKYHIDWLGAQALPGDEADALIEWIGDPSGKK